MTIDSHNEPAEISASELSQRVAYALLRAAVRYATAAGLTAAEVAELLETASFEEVRARGATLDEAAARLGVSRRTAARLSQQLKSRFLEASRAHSLPRRIEFMLGAESLSEARLRQVIRDVDGEAVSAALAELVREGRVEPVPGRVTTYRASAGVRSLARDTWVRRVGALSSFAENLADAAYGRFALDDARAFARTLSFHVAPERLGELQTLYERALLPAIVALGADAEEAAGPVGMKLSVCWAPYELIDASMETQKGGAR